MTFKVDYTGDVPNWPKLLEIEVRQFRSLPAYTVDYRRWYDRLRDGIILRSVFGRRQPVFLASGKHLPVYKRLACLRWQAWQDLRYCEPALAVSSVAYCYPPLRYAKPRLNLSCRESWCPFCWFRQYAVISLRKLQNWLLADPSHRRTICLQVWSKIFSEGSLEESLRFPVKPPRHGLVLRTVAPLGRNWRLRVAILRADVPRGIGGSWPVGSRQLTGISSSVLAMTELCEYPFSLLSCPPEQLADWIVGSKRQRMLETYGEFRGSSRAEEVSG